MKTYKELKDNFYEEVGRIDLSKLSLGGFGGNTYRDYAELLKTMAELEEKNFIENISGFCCANTRETPKVEREVK